MLVDSVNRWQMSAIDGVLIQQTNERLENLATVLCEFSARMRD